MSAAPVTIWAGPVNAQQNGDLRWPGSSAVYVPCTGDGSGGTAICPAEATVAQAVAAGATATEVYGAAFSAGGRLWEKAIPQLRGKLRGLMLCDGTYADAMAGDRPSLAGVENRAGLVLQAALLEAEDAPAVLCTASSSPNGAKPNGSAVLREIVRFCEERGVKWNRSGLEFLAGGKLRRAETWGSGRALLMDFGDTVSHTETATVVAREVWPAFVALGAVRRGPVRRWPRWIGPVVAAVTAIVLWAGASRRR